MKSSIRVYVDMDDVLCDYATAHREQLILNPEIGYPQSIYGFYRKLKPLPDAIRSYHFLHENFDTWILTRPSYKNPLCYTEKREWVEEHLGLKICERLIICPDKSLLEGKSEDGVPHILIDDYPWPNFKGVQLHFGTRYNWKGVWEYMSALI